MSVSIESPSSFQDSEKEAWQYFRNAFSVHTELLYQRTDITAVLVCPLHINQIRIGLTDTLGLNSHGKSFESEGYPALTSKHLQTTFVQGVAFPQLESMLCSVAVRLALEKGMHRRPNKGWNLSDAEVAERNRVFWVLYFLDKTIALRSGRPSVSNHCDRTTPQADSQK
jgi:hypothetical protein